MQRPALRSIYGSSQHKTKHAAAVSPILDQPDLDNDDDDELSTNITPALSHTHAIKSGGNNWCPRVSMISIPQCDGDDQAATGVVLQRKSAQYELPRLGAATLVGSVPFSNQEADTTQLSPSRIVQKYAVLGQKQQWRRSRAQRTRRLGQGRTIAPVEDDADPSISPDNDVDLENPVQTKAFDCSPRFSINEVSNTSSNTSSSRGDSARYDSERSAGRSSSPGGDGDERQRFVVTRQKKSKFAARIHLPGQNPLYLGRYKSAEAALAACEQAFATITTPRR